MGALTEIAEKLLAQAKIVDAHLEKSQSPQASFKEYNLDDLPKDVKAARDDIVDQAATLQQLCEPPGEYFFWSILAKWADMTSVQVLYHYGIPEAVPLKGSMSYKDIATKVDASEEMVKRFIRQAQGNHIFAETETGEVCHTTLSRLMAIDKGLKDAYAMQVLDLAPGGLAFMETVTKYGEPCDQDSTAFSYVNSPDEKKSIFQVFSEQPERARRFGGAMRWLTSGGTWDLKHLLSVFDFPAIDKKGLTLVDVGGGHGQVAQYIAENTTNLSLIVQDLPHVVANAKTSVPESLHNRLTFMPQSFLEPQTLNPADVDIFFFRWILHNWSDKYAVTILKSLVPALKPGSKVLVFEYVLEEKPVTEQTKRMGRALDVVMAVAFAGKERTEAEFEDLFAQADPRYRFDGVSSTDESSLSLVTVTWDPEGSRVNGNGVNGHAKVNGDHNGVNGTSLPLR